MDNKTAAAAHAQEVVKLNPAFSAATYMTTQLYRQDSDREHHRNALIKAGLPE